MALKPTTSTESLSCFHECEVLLSEVLSSAYRPKAMDLEPLTTSVTLPNFAANACTSPVMANAPELGTYTRYVVGLPMHSPAGNQHMCVIMRMGPYVLPSVLTHCADTAPVVALNTHIALSKSRGVPVAAENAFDPPWGVAPRSAASKSVLTLRLTTCREGGRTLGGTDDVCVVVRPGAEVVRGACESDDRAEVGVRRQSVLSHAMS